MPRLSRAKPTITLQQMGIVRLDDYVNAVAFSRDGTRVAACAASGQVGVWYTERAQSACTMKGHRDAALTLGWHPSGRVLVSGGQDGAVRVWEAHTGEERGVLPVGPPGSWVEHLKWDGPLDRFAASGGKMMRVWSCAEDGTCIPAAEVSSHKTTVSALAWMPGGGRIISACYGGAWLWKMGADKPQRSFSYDGAPLSIAASPNGQYLVSGNLDSSVHLWRTDTDQNWHMSGYPSKVQDVLFDAGGNNLMTTAGPSLVMWNMRKFEGSSGRLFKGHLGWIQGMDCHPAQPVVATVGEEGLLCVWEASTTKPMVSREVNQSGGLSCVVWSRQGTWLATGASDGSVCLFKVEGIGE